MKKFKIFSLVLVLGLILVLSAACLQNAGVNQEDEGLTPENQIMPETTEPSADMLPTIPAEEIPAPVPPLP